MNRDWCHDVRPAGLAPRWDCGTSPACRSCFYADSYFKQEMRCSSPQFARQLLPVGKTHPHTARRNWQANLPLAPIRQPPPAKGAGSGCHLPPPLTPRTQRGWEGSEAKDDSKAGKARPPETAAPYGSGGAAVPGNKNKLNPRSPPLRPGQAFVPLKGPCASLLTLPFAPSKARPVHGQFTDSSQQPTHFHGVTAEHWVRRPMCRALILCFAGRAVSRCAVSFVRVLSVNYCGKATTQAKSGL